MEQNIMTEEGQILRSRIRLDPPSDNENLASFLRNRIRQHSSRTLLVDASKGSSWTGRALLDKVERVATGLIELANLKPGQVVLTICDHSDHELLLALGIIMAGGAVHGSSPGDSYMEEVDYCNMVKPSIIVCNSNLHQMVLKLKQDVLGLEDTQIIWIDDPTKQSASSINGVDQNMNSNNNNLDGEYYSELMKGEQVILFDDLLEGPINSSLINDVIDNRINGKTQHVTFLLTSGSTGKPKAVANTHEELVWALQALLCCTKYPVGSNKETPSDNCDRVASKKAVLPMDENSVIAGDLPLDHGAGVVTMFLSLLVGSKLVILPSYREDSFWQGVHDYRITTSIASTTFTYKLLFRLKQVMDLGEHKRWDLSSFTYLTCCGSKLAFRELVKEINVAYPQLYIGQSYGCTETAFISVLDPEDCRRYLDSVGNLVPGMIGKVICPDTGKLLGPNQRGQLHLSSMTKFKTYKCVSGEDSTELYAQCHDESGIFYKTGDYVHYDEEQRLYIHGRMKDTLVLMQDWKILPTELEDVINQHPLVEYSAVIGVPDPDLPGCDAPKAFVKLIDTKSKEFHELKDVMLRDTLLDRDENFIAHDIYKFVANRTAEPKHLKGGVRILEDFPRNGLLGKIDRKILKTMD